MRSADHYIVPAMSEMILDGYVDRSRNGEDDDWVLIEPISHILEVVKLTVTPCLANVADNTTVKIRVMNPFN